MAVLMTRSHAHQPPPATVVAALMRAGVSWDTAMAMERWKAQEVLELLQHHPQRHAVRGQAQPGVVGS